MKKLIFSALAVVALVGFSFNSIQDAEALGLTVTFCTHGSAGSCVAAPGGGGFDCVSGGSECGGTYDKEIR